MLECKDYKIQALGGEYAPTTTITQEYYNRDQNMGSKQDDGSYITNSPVKLIEAKVADLVDIAKSMFFKHIDYDRIVTAGKGGTGAGFQDSCQQRFEGTFTKSVIWRNSGDVIYNYPPEVIESNCIDNDEKNVYGTKEGYYEHIHALPGNGGAAIITW